MADNGQEKDAPKHRGDTGPAPSGGEDDGSTEKNGDDSHLHEDQKSRRLKT